MKKIVLFCMFLFSFSLICPAIAQDVNPYTFNNGAQQPKDEGLNTDNTDADNENSDDFYNEMIRQQYGSDESPAFNNRQKINPTESDYDYGTSGGND